MKNIKKKVLQLISTAIMFAMLLSMTTLAVSIDSTILMEHATEPETSEAVEPYATPDPISKLYLTQTIKSVKIEDDKIEDTMSEQVGN